MSPIRLRLRELREARGWTQAQLAERIDAAVSTVSDIERETTSRIDFTLLERLARALAVEPGELIELKRRVTAAARSSSRE
jgi:transcriptional regulator with XRE-family HTH domain